MARGRTDVWAKRLYGSRERPLRNCLLRRPDPRSVSVPNSVPVVIAARPARISTECTRVPSGEVATADPTTGGSGPSMIGRTELTSGENSPASAEASTVENGTPGAQRERAHSETELVGEPVVVGHG